MQKVPTCDSCVVMAFLTDTEKQKAPRSLVSDVPFATDCIDMLRPAYSMKIMRDYFMRS